MILSVGQYSCLHHDESDEVAVGNEKGQVVIKKQVLEKIQDGLNDQATWESHGMPFDLAKQLELI